MSFVKSPPMELLHIAGYRFVDIDDGAALRATLLRTLQRAGVLGTVLIAPEGINLALAGAPHAVHGWLDGVLRADARFAALQVHETRSTAPPFARLLVKCKGEIVRMNQPQLRPAAQRATAVSPLTLARWLAQGRCDAGRPLALLDTRNAFEVDAGAFDGATDWRLSRFSDFAAAFDQHRAALVGKTVVSYCTGGIRCEKAALLMQQRGQQHVWQLDGGILGYLAAAAAAGDAPRHWHGGCVVFDGRGMVDATLRSDAAGVAFGDGSRTLAAATGAAAPAFEPASAPLPAQAFEPASVPSASPAPG